MPTKPMPEDKPSKFELKIANLAAEVGVRARCLNEPEKAQLKKLQETLGGLDLKDEPPKQRPFPAGVPLVGPEG